MKKYVYILLFFACMFVTFMEVEASNCTLNDRVRFKELASKVKATYETDYIREEDSGGEVYNAYVLYLKIYNVSPELDFKLSDGINSKDLNYSMLNEDGSITIRIKDVSKVRNYKIDIYPNSYNCLTEKVRTIKLTLPMYNYNSSYDVCDGVEDYYMCQKFVFNEVDYDNFYTSVTNYKNKIASQKEEEMLLEENNEGDNVITAATKHKYVLVIIIVVLGIVATVVVLKRKGSAK